MTYIDYFFFFYSFGVMLFYGVSIILARDTIKRYFQTNKRIAVDQLLRSSLLPKVSLIAPAYNEGVSIVDNVRSLLAVKYTKLDIIVVNDGSSDDTMEKLIKRYKLKQVRIKYEEALKTEVIRATYISESVTSHKLIVIDKENGGKADALNAGLNVANSELVACIDVDCVLESDSIIRMVKPFLSNKTRVIATGGTVRISNASRIVKGKLVKARIPKKLIERFQFLEYLRAFLIGRMSWSRLGALLIISGAFGMFKKRIAVACGGYRTDTVGEDMELIVRMRKHMHEQNKPYKVCYIPEPLCWTEVPDTLAMLGRQRNRWTRGLMDTLKIHKNMMFNPRYNIIGLLSYPFWVLFEWLAPLLELFGLVYIITQFVQGGVSVPYFLSLIALVYVFAVMVSCFALLQDEISHMKYTNDKGLFTLLFTALLEPIIYHPLTVYWAIRGNIDFLRNKKSWGAMTRSGFSAT